MSIIKKSGNGIIVLLLASLDSFDSSLIKAYMKWFSQFNNRVFLLTSITRYILENLEYYTGLLGEKGDTEKEPLRESDAKANSYTRI